MNDEQKTTGISDKENSSAVRVTAETVRLSLSKARSRRNSRVRILRAVAIVVLTCLVALFAVSHFFLKVANIEVSGNERYTAEQILESAGIKTGMNLFAVKKSRVKEEIKTDFAGISDVKVRRVLPSTVRLEIVENVPVMYVTVGEYFYTLDEDLLILQKYEDYSSVEAQGLIRLYLPQVTRCLVGEHLQTEDADISDMVTEFYSDLDRFSLLSHVSELDFRDKFNILFTLGFKYTVKFGNILDADIKLEFLNGILDDLDEQDNGTIEFSNNDIHEAIFSRR